MSYKIVSLFSGCGGLDYGFHKKGFPLVYAADNDVAAIKNFTHNLHFKAKKIDVRSKDFLEDIKSIGKVDIVLGGFPCQGFSKAGPKVKNDPRNILYTSMLNAVKELKPIIFIAENVDGMAQNFKGEYVEIIKNDFQSIGYNVDYRILNAVDFGVPQYRRRIIFIGVLNSISTKVSWPQPTHSGGSRNGEFKTQWDNHSQLNSLNSIYSPQTERLLNPISISQSISDLLEVPLGTVDDHVISSKITKKDIAIVSRIGLGQKLCNVRFANSSVYTWQIPEVFGEVTERERIILETIGKNRRRKIYGNVPNGNPLSKEVISKLIKDEVKDIELKNLLQKGYLKEVAEKYDLSGAMFCSGLYKRPNWNKPSPTIITLSGIPRYFVHPVKNRPFSVRECARLQSFPDSFKFLESGVSVEDAFRLIGNAVPPLLSEKIADMATNILNRKN